MKVLISATMALTAMAMPLLPASAGRPQQNAVQFNDLDLDTEAGKAVLDTRIRNVARRVCDSQPRTGSRLSSTECLSDIRKQVLAQIEQIQDRVGKGG